MAAQVTLEPETAVAVGITSTDIVTVDSNTNLLVLSNDSDTKIYISTNGADAVVGEGSFVIPVGGIALFDISIPVGTIKGIHGGTGTKKILVSKG